MSRMHQVAVENEEIAERGSYRTRDGATVEIGGLLRAARAGTVSYGPQAVPGVRAAGRSRAPSRSPRRAACRPGRGWSRPAASTSPC
ncbi:hypothetical protein [Kitasatospora paranensis]|uniref:hypothetical protein n=1 Tax=Kitasatospora paranensis TaxID=258053 RepID=UPI0031F0A70F